MDPMFTYVMQLPAIVLSLESKIALRLSVYNVSFDEYKNGSETDRRQGYDEPEVALHFTFSSKEEHFTHDLVVRFSCSHGSRFP